MSKQGENIKKRKDGRYEARYIKNKTDTGKTIWGYVYGKSYKEAKQKREAVLSELKQSLRTNVNNTTINCVIDDFLLQESFRVKESTFSHYSTIINSHIRPEIGTLSSATIKSTDIEIFAYKKLNSGRLDGTGGLSSKSVKDILSLLKKILKYGIDKNTINEEVLRFSLPKTKRNKIQVLSKEDLNLISSKARNSDDMYVFGIYFCLCTGLRIGEICALKWNDFDLESKTLSINKTMLRIYDLSPDAQSKTKVIVDAPKTQKSDRIIPLPDFIIPSLCKQKEFIENENTYFLTGTFKYIEPRTYYEKYKKFLKTNNLYPYTFHALRHTFATHCIEIGFDPKTLSEILGHSDVKVTLDRYVHPSMDLKRNYMNMLEIV